MARGSSSSTPRAVSHSSMTATSGRGPRGPHPATHRLRSRPRDPTERRPRSRRRDRRGGSGRRRRPHRPRAATPIPGRQAHHGLGRAKGPARLGLPRPHRQVTRLTSRARSTTEAPNRIVHDADHGTTLPGTQVRAEGDPATDDTAVNEACDLLGLTWELWHAAYHRNSLDDRGLVLIATAHATPTAE